MIFPHAEKQKTEDVIDFAIKWDKLWIEFYPDSYSSFINLSISVIKSLLKDNNLSEVSLSYSTKSS